jgi:hypothetical protein
MLSYNKNFRNANSASFARQATLDAHPKSRWALDDPDFEDRSPSEKPSLADEFLARLKLLGIEAAE